MRESKGLFQSVSFHHMPVIDRNVGPVNSVGRATELQADSSVQVLHKVHFFLLRITSLATM